MTGKILDSNSDGILYRIVRVAPLLVQFITFVACCGYIADQDSAPLWEKNFRHTTTTWSDLSKDATSGQAIFWMFFAFTLVAHVMSWLRIFSVPLGLNIEEQCRIAFDSPHMVLEQLALISNAVLLENHFHTKFDDTSIGLAWVVLVCNAINILLEHAPYTHLVVLGDNKITKKSSRATPCSMMMLFIRDACLYVALAFSIGYWGLQQDHLAWFSLESWVYIWFVFVVAFCAFDVARNNDLRENIERQLKADEDNSEDESCWPTFFKILAGVSASVLFVQLVWPQSLVVEDDYPMPDDGIKMINVLGVVTLILGLVLKVETDHGTKTRATFVDTFANQDDILRVAPALQRSKNKNYMLRI